MQTTSCGITTGVRLMRYLFYPHYSCLPALRRPLTSTEFDVCGACIKQKPPLEKTIAPFYYQEPLRHLLHLFKYQQGLYLSDFLSNLIIDALNPEILNTACLIPVPMHRKKMQQRGFNQAVELTKQLAKKLNKPYGLDYCKKIINTPPQASLSAKQRLTNLKQAFTTTLPPYQHITLIDDLLTTGSTANQLAFAFKQQGVTRVDLWCCARA